MTLPSPTEAAAYRRHVLLATPFALAVVVVLGLLVLAITGGLHWLALGAGVAGWIVAYLLRAPVAFVLQRRGDAELKSPWLVAASGPAEELVRLALLLVLGRDLTTALSLGLGWAAIEAVFGVASSNALALLFTRDDDEARRVRAALPARPGTLTPSGAWWGVVERVWASTLHLVFSVLIAWQPLLVLATIVLHSATNLGVLRLIERTSMVQAEIAGIAWTLLLVVLTAALVGGWFG